MHAVQELICNRLAGNANPSFKLAIVAEDGGQRWPLVGGMMARLEAHGIHGDIILGTSAGAHCSAYAALRQTQEAHGIIPYTTRHGMEKPRGRKHRSKRQDCFILHSRMLQRKPVMDLERLIEGVFTTAVPLQWEKFATLQTPFYVMATRRDGTAVPLPMHGATALQAKENLKATARIPLINIADLEKELWDGGLSEGLAIETAFNLGATHVLALRCASRAEARRTNKEEALFCKHVLHKQAPDLAELIQNRHTCKAQTVERFCDHPRVLMVQAEKTKVGTFTTNPRKLYGAGVQGWDLLGETLGLPQIPVPEAWRHKAKKGGAKRPFSR